MVFVLERQQYFLLNSVSLSETLNKRSLILFLPFLCANDLVKNMQMQNIMKSDNHSNISIHKGLFNTVKL